VCDSVSSTLASFPPRRSSDLACHPAENTLTEPGMPISAHDQHLRVRIDSVSAKNVRHGTVFARQSMDGNLDAMASKEGRNVGARLLAVEMFPFDWVDQGEVHLLGGGK